MVKWLNLNIQHSGNTAVFKNRVGGRVYQHCYCWFTSLYLANQHVATPNPALPIAFCNNNNCTALSWRRCGSAVEGNESFCLLGEHCPSHSKWIWHSSLLLYSNNIDTVATYTGDFAARSKCCKKSITQQLSYKLLEKQQHSLFIDCGSIFELICSCCKSLRVWHITLNAACLIYVRCNAKSTLWHQTQVMNGDGWPDT